MVSCGHTPRHCIFSYPTEDGNGNVCTLVALSPLEIEDEQSADEHGQLVEYFLRLNKKSSSYIVAVIADNCPVNEAVVHQLG